MAEPFDDVGVCVDCHSDQADAYMIKSPFFKQGGSVPCQYCGGPTIIVNKDARKQALARNQRERGL